jgi:16S rRNA processing protein RimM
MPPADRPKTKPDGRPAEPEIAPGFVRVGKITGAHGLVGAMRMRPDNPDSDTLERVRRVFVGPNAREYTLRNAKRINPSTIRIVLDGVSGLDAAEAMRGAAVMVPIADLPATGPGEFYHFQVLGCEVITTDGRRLGVIAEVLSTGANDVWVVRGGAAEVLVPVIEDVVKTIDLDARKMTIEAVPGLLD